MSNFGSAPPGGPGAAPASILGRRKAAEKRLDERHHLARETVVIGYNGAKLVVDLVNLSGGGAMIEADIRPQMWNRIDLYLGEGNPIECAVRWLRGARIGLEFAHETQIDCPPEERDALLREILRRNFPDAVAEAPPAFDAARRTARRHPLIWNGTIRSLDRSCTVRLRNISASGVLIDSPDDLPVGIELVLDLGQSGKYAATVGWSRGGQAGLLFKIPFDLSALAAKRPEVAAQRWEKPAYLDRCSDDSSPWDSGWDRSKVADLRADLEGFLKY